MRSLQQKPLALALAATLALAAAGAPAAAQDHPEPGWQTESLPYPGTTSVQSMMATLSTEEYLSWDGLAVQLWSADGTSAQTLSAFTSFAWPSVLLVSPDESFAVIGESSVGDLHTVDLKTGATSFLANVFFNFDAVFEDADHLLISAATGGFSTGNDILRLDLATGATTTLIHVEGPSGPLALDEQGNLYYAVQSTAFPSLPGSIDVLFWPAGSFDGSTLLDESDAFVFGSGFDGGSSLAVDPETGMVLLAESSWTTGVSRIVRVNGGPATSFVLLEGEPGRWISDMEITTQPGGAVLGGYQPQHGGILRYTASDFATYAARTALTPRRPTAAVSGPGLLGAGPFDLTLEHGTPGGTALLAFSTTALPAEFAAAQIGATPLWLGLDPGSLFVVPGAFALDGTGAATLAFQNPGGLEGLVAIQALVLDATGLPRGTSTVGQL